MSGGRLRFAAEALDAEAVGGGGLLADVEEADDSLDVDAFPPASRRNAAAAAASRGDDAVSVDGAFGPG